MTATVSDMLLKSMKGAGTNDDSLIRLLLYHAEVRLLFKLLGRVTSGELIACGRDIQFNVVM